MLRMWWLVAACLMLAALVSCKPHRSGNNLDISRGFYTQPDDNNNNINPSVRDLSGDDSFATSKELADLGQALLEEYSSLLEYPFYKIPLVPKQKKGVALRSAQQYSKRNMGVDLSDILRRNNKNLLMMIQRQGK